ncbi:MAG TPA: glycosyl hydrolase 53 family protein [Balneolales bacterium]|nr:glycosyl hydrolase 53 family protein [Balneolales bacterium]
MAQFDGLLNSGITGVKDVSDTVKIMIHIDRGGDYSGAKWFFDNLNAQGVNFDIIGLSYYPWWHGSLTDLTNNLDQLAVRYHKPILIAETAYPWTLRYDDNAANIVGSSNQLLPVYPATVDGQKSYLDKVFDIVHNVPDHTKADSSQTVSQAEFTCISCR